MKITCDFCDLSAHFDAFTTSDPARFKCRGCGKEWGLALVLGFGPRKVKTVVHHDPRQRQLFDLACEGDECAEADLFKESQRPRPTAEDIRESCRDKEAADRIGGHPWSNL
jgi:hypothetical protein